MATREDAIDLCNSDGENNEDDADSDSSDSSDDESKNKHSSTNRSQNVIVRQHDKEPSSSTTTTTTTTTNCVAAVAERQQHTVIVSVHFSLTDAIYAAEDYVREEFGIDADMNDYDDDNDSEDDEAMESELDGVDWSEDGWLRSDPTTHLEHRVYILEKPVS